MPHLLKRKLLLFLTILLSFFLLNDVSWAQEKAAGLGISVPVEGDISSGSVLCGSGPSYTLCTNAYDSEIFGVVADNAAIALEASDPGSQRLLIRNGVVKVNVNSMSGNIAEGDVLTSSSVPGVAQKAAGNGTVLGTAMQSYESTDVQAVGQIAMVVNVHLKAGFTGKRSNLWNMVRQGLSSSVFEPLDSLRYLLAVIIVIIAFTLGISYFGRVARSGVEAMGRNPLAKSSIQLGIVLSILLSFVMILVGLGLAYLILIL